MGNLLDIRIAPGVEEGEEIFKISSKVLHIKKR